MIPVAYQDWCINVYCMYAYCLCITNIVTVMIEERKRVQGLTCWAPVIALNRARSFNTFPYMLEWTTYIFISMHIVQMKLRVIPKRLGQAKRSSAWMLLNSQLKDKMGVLCSERGVSLSNNSLTIMAVRVVEFSNKGSKLERFLHRNQHAQRTQLNPNLDPGAPTRPKIGFKSGSFGFIKYIIGLNPNLNPFWGQPEPIGPVFWPWEPTQPNSTRISGPKSGSTRKNSSGLAALFPMQVKWEWQAPGSWQKQGPRKQYSSKKGTWIVSGIQWTPFVFAHFWNYFLQMIVRTLKFVKP